MEITVKMLTGATRIFEVKSSDTVEDFRFMYEASHLGCGCSEACALCLTCRLFVCSCEWQ